MKVKKYCKGCGEFHTVNHQQRKCDICGEEFEEGISLGDRVRI